MAEKTRYTVNQLARLAGVTPRTLRYYDTIGLLRPAATGLNGYRYYAGDALFRLQQILFFRELGLSLEQIQAALDAPGFDLLRALDGHRQALQDRVERLNRLIDTVDRTILDIRGEINMSKNELYAGFDEEQQKRYAEEARRRWGEPAAASQRKWDAYPMEEKNRILAHMGEISSGVAANMEKGVQSPEVQYWVDAWYRHINQYFYACSLETFEALGRMYVEDPAFSATYEAIRPGLAVFMRDAMEHYCITQSAG